MDDKVIRKYALQNALNYDGKANVGAVIGKILAELPEAKENIKALSKEVLVVVAEVNKLRREEQLKTLEKLAPELLEKKEPEKRNIFGFLQIPIGTVVKTGFPPEPSKYMHIGHAKAAIMNYELAKQHNGSFVLRFEDTNPTAVENQYYKIIQEDLEWLGLVLDQVDYASDFMEEFYKCAEILVKKGDAYVCLCPQEKIKKNRFKGIACECRSASLIENLTNWKKMFLMPARKAVLRLRIDLKHKNSTMRDPTIMRIIKKAHPRREKKYVVWPTYDFENAVMDGISGITHRLRSKEFEMRAELQHHIQSLLGFKKTFTYEFARFNLEGVESSGRKIREGIKKREFIGWDDPRLTTLVALKRRGFLPEAIKDFVMSTGLTKAEATLSWEDLIAHNSRLLDPICQRYFFIKEPKRIIINNAPEQTVKLKLHPDAKQAKRIFKTTGKFYIPMEDYKTFKLKQLIRLMDCLNFTVERNKELVFHSTEHARYKKGGARIIHWLPVQKDLAKVEIMMPDATIVKGLAEPLVKKLKPGDEIQFERFGFCKYDRKDKDAIVFWYTHN